MTLLTKMTTKGQVVIPVDIREELNIEEGTPLAVSRLREFIILKKINITDPKKEFEKLTGWGETFARKKGIKNEQKVVTIIHKSRSKHRLTQ